MQIQTSRFGTVELNSEDIIEFSEGILGFASLRKFVLLDDPTDEIFAWLQSCESPAIAFPVLEPELFLAAKYNIQFNRRDYDALQMVAGEKFHTFCIITIPNDPRQMTANLKAPVIINSKKRFGRQCVLQDNSLAIREPIFAALQQRVVQTPPQAIKSKAMDTGVAVRLPVASL
ncbi:MAG: flagellar assembly protein FliW [Pseudomonadota bacterium]|nr:flagellar assembly protein FliW [Pseudomonadota bacterium]